MGLALAFALYCVGFMIILERLLAMLVESLGKLMVSGSQGWMMRNCMRQNDVYTLRDAGVIRNLDSG